MTETTDSAAELARLEASVAEHRALLADNPDKLYPVFADALVTMGSLLAELGRTQEAVAASEEGVAHLRDLVEADGATFRVHLASALNNLSNRLSEAERDEDGRRMGAEAVDLAAAALSDPEADQARFVLVSALMNQSGRSWRAGDSERALQEMSMAVDAFREGGAAMDQFLGIMVDALHKNAMALAEADRWDEALVLRRMTARVFPEGAPVPVPVPHLLALTLEQAAFALSRSGHAGQSLPLVEEAVQIARELAGADPEHYTVFLGQALSNLASRQFEAGASPDALDACLEAIQIYQDAAQDNAGEVIVPLAMTLETFATVLRSLGHEEQAQSVLAQRDELMEIVKNVENLGDDGHEHGNGCGCH